MALVKKYDKELSNTLVGVRCFGFVVYSVNHSPYLGSQTSLLAALSAAFVINIRPQLRSYSNDRSALLPHTNASPVVPPSQISPSNDPPPNELVTAATLLCACLMISILATFGVVLGQQWLNRYLSRDGGSMIERCVNRQLKCDGLKKWGFDYFIRYPRYMLQIALVLFACGLYEFMKLANNTVAYTLIVLVALGALFYVVVAIAGAFSYGFPLQTSLSALLGRLGRRIKPGWTSTIWPNTRDWLLRYTVDPHQQDEQLTILEEVQAKAKKERANQPWISEERRANTEKTNADEVWCVSWVLNSVNDSEVFDNSLERAGIIRWFGNGIDVKSIYDTILSVFGSCLDLNDEVYPGARDRAYHSGRAILWIHVLATFEPDGSVPDFPLPPARCTTPAYDDLTHLLVVMAFIRTHAEPLEVNLLPIDITVTASHLQWTSNLLLLLSWHHSSLITPGVFGRQWPSRTASSSFPSATRFNCVLACCNLIRVPVEREVLKIEDKSCGISYSRHLSHLRYCSLAIA